MASTTGSVTELVEHLASELLSMRPLLPTYIHLLISAIFPIYTAAHASLARPPSAAPTTKAGDEASTGEVEQEEASQRIETLTPSDAILFPVLAGGTLASLYFILKWLQDPALLNYYLGLYFAVVGLFFAVKFIKDGSSIIRSLVFPGHYSYDGKLWRLSSDADCFVSGGEATSSTTRSSPFPGRLSVLFQRRNSAIWSIRKFVYMKFRLDLKIVKLVSLTTSVDMLDLAGLALAAPLVYYHTFIDKPWFLTNFLGFSFCYGSLQFTTPGTSWTGTLLLTALFFYDIYFVFFTPIMVTVATSLDIPIKLLFPRPDGCVLPLGAAEGSAAMEEYLQCLAKKRAMAMLGLGDIVVPGMMLAFALRFDLYLHYQRLAKSSSSQTGNNQGTPAKVPYLPATGAWGERFWTNNKFQSANLRAKQFPKTYFYASVTGYVFGMIATLVAMQLMNHAQPALLYLVPGVLISLWGTTLVKGDLKALWNYSEVSDEQDGTEPKGDQTKDKSKDISTNQKVPKTERPEIEAAEKSNDKNGKDDKVPPEENPVGTKTDSPESKLDALRRHIIYFSLSLADSKPQSQTQMQTQPSSSDKPSITPQLDDNPGDETEKDNAIDTSTVSSLRASEAWDSIEASDVSTSEQDAGK